MLNLELINTETFIDNYNLLSEYYDDFDRTIRVTYFSFTSLTTVGFGDFTPRSDYERLSGGFILLFGVAIFSYINGNFIAILMDN